MLRRLETTGVKNPDVLVIYESNVLVDKLPFHIGRLQCSDFVLADIGISRRHCVINKDTEGNWEIEAVTNLGISINGQMLGTGNKRLLANKDRITLNDEHVYEFVLNYETNDQDSIKKPLEPTTLNTNNNNKNENPTYKGYVPETALTRLAADHADHVASLKLNLETFLEELGTSRDLNRQLEAEIDRLREELQQLHQQLDRRNADFDNVETSALIKIECEELNASLEELRKQRDVLMKERDDYKARFEDSERKILNVGNQIARERDDKKQALLNQVLKLESIMESELVCAICLEIVIDACTINCGHTFCAKCFQDWEKKKPVKCPTCRAAFSSRSRSAMLDSLVVKLMENTTDEFKRKRALVLAERHPAPAAKKRRGRQTQLQFPVHAAPVVPEPEVFIDLTTSF